MSDDGGSLDDDDRLGRLEGIQQHLQDLEEIGYPFLHLPDIFEHDPVAKPPYLVSDSFIPESVGGNIRVVHRDPEEDIHDSLATENLEQMLGSYLPGGYKQRWGNFNLWQGRWEPVQERPGSADIAPMFEFDDRLPLSDLLGTEREDYTGYELPTEDVTIYLPRTMHVRRLPYDTRYCWHEEFENISPPKEAYENACDAAAYLTAHSLDSGVFEHADYLNVNAPEPVEGHDPEMAITRPSEVYDMDASHEDHTVRLHDRIWERMATGEVPDPPGTDRRAKERDVEGLFDPE